MLMHEWIRYRKQQVEKAESEEQGADEEAQDAASEEEPQEAEEAVPEEETVSEASPTDDTADSALHQLPVEVPDAADPLADTEAGEIDASSQGGAADAESQDSERDQVLDSLQQELDRTGESMQERVRQLRARQKQLPMELGEVAEEKDTEDASGSRSATETRQELVQRLLDPTLTLREAALLLDVCPTTVRRYTNRGLLKCFRTPGNQRRFNLSSVLEFLERRERGEV